MIIIDAKDMEYTALNETVRGYEGEFRIKNCLGQRFIGAGLPESRKLSIEGIPGNALGAYLDGATLEVHGNAQDAVGDTMNAGTIIIHGNVGDTAGYAMRGGQIYVRGTAGYRSGIHMKASREKLPVLVIGGHAGSFLGEYQAGGYIIVLGLSDDGKPIVSNFPSTGMHGGKLFLRSACEGIRFPDQVTARPATAGDLEEIMPYLARFAGYFGMPVDMLAGAPFTVVTPNSANPYRQMYVAN